jgi:hypothetical protein
VNEDDEGISYIFDGGQPTLEDPRLGPLPPEWRIRYGLGHALNTRGINLDMNLTERCLEYIRYGLDWMLRDQERDEAETSGSDTLRTLKPESIPGQTPDSRLRR